jgi:IrrE N-terminal-like domain
MSSGVSADNVSTNTRCTPNRGTVSLKTDAYYRTIAADALERIPIPEPPVPVDALVNALGIPIRAVSLPAFFTAATVYEDGLPVIVLNWARPELERRRALAHMLGHLLLVLADDGQSYPREAGPHLEADIVAREIMLPGPMVVEQARLWFNDHRYLARLFGVEEAEMVERMRQLGLVKSAATPVWDY